MLSQANLRRNQLREAIEIIEKKTEDGEPWGREQEHEISRYCVTATRN
jgi:hypothetical protein